MASDVLKFDLTSQTFLRNPVPTLTRMLEAGPVVRIKVPFIGKTWVVTSHAAVNDLLKDDATFVRNPKNAGTDLFAGGLWWLPRSFRVLSENMLGHDDPDHRRLRKLVDQAFNRQSVEGMRERIGVIADGLLDGLKTNEPQDLMEGLARPLPMAVICELLGLPEEDRPNFRKWAKAMMSVTSLWGIFWAVPGMSRLMSYFKRHFEECRRNPRPGLMTALVQAEQDGDKLSENELLAMAFLLLLAGHETTVHLIGGGVLALLQHPEQKARLLADWSLVPSAVEEVLRFVCPVQVTKPRYVSRDVEFCGKTLSRGQMVMAMLASANVDAARFAEPERFDVARSPNPHVSFGTGKHFCLGAQLARTETQVVLEKLFTRFPNLTSTVSESALSYTGRFGLRGLKALPIRV